MNQTAFKKAEEFDPEIVVIMLGTNDANPEIAHSEDNFEADYAQLVASFEGLEGDQQIWVVKSPPIFSDNSNYNNTYLSHTVLPQIDDLANQLNLPTVDVYSAFGTHSDYFMDGVHPNADGAALIASNICDAITSPDSSFNDSSASGP
jgi:lysophospholipase L1-like esterase